MAKENNNGILMKVSGIPYPAVQRILDEEANGATDWKERFFQRVEKELGEKGLRLAQWMVN